MLRCVIVLTPCFTRAPYFDRDAPLGEEGVRRPALTFHGVIRRAGLYDHTFSRKSKQKWNYTFNFDSTLNLETITESIAKPTAIK